MARKINANIIVLTLTFNKNMSKPFIDFSIHSIRLAFTPFVKGAEVD